MHPLRHDNVALNIIPIIQPCEKKQDKLVPAHFGGISPQPLQLVVLARFIEHGMHNDITVVQYQPT